MPMTLRHLKGIYVLLQYWYLYISNFLENRRLAGDTIVPVYNTDSKSHKVVQSHRRLTDFAWLINQQLARPYRLLQAVDNSIIIWSLYNSRNAYCTSNCFICVTVDSPKSISKSASPVASRLNDSYNTNFILWSSDCTTMMDINPMTIWPMKYLCGTLRHSDLAINDFIPD